MADAVCQTVNPQHGSHSDRRGPGVEGLAASVSLRHAPQRDRQQGEEGTERQTHERIPFDSTSLFGRWRAFASRPL